MKFSLVLATISRTDELIRFVRSVDAQTHKDLELLVVDQNPDDRLVPLLEPFKERVDIIHLKSSPGLSRARNIGLHHVRGDIVAFPDDDCWYPPNLLEDVAGLFGSDPKIDGYSVCLVNEKGKPLIRRFMNGAGRLTRYNIWKKIYSATLFLPRRVIDDVGFFNEDYGVGSGTQFGSAEDMDYVLRAFDKGYELYFALTPTVFHPDPHAVFDEKTQNRGYSYSVGMGHVMRIHNYPIPFFLYNLLRPAIGILAATLQGDTNKAKFRWRVVTGRLAGWRTR